MAKESTFDKIERNLFKDRSEAALVLTSKELEIKDRLMLCVSKKMADPLIEDAELVTFLMGGCGGTAARISDSQAYRDIAMVNRLVGNIQLASKSWYRYQIVEGAKKAYAMAIKKEDAKGAAACLDKIGKYTRSDKEDDSFDFSQLIPPSFEPSDDITLIEGMEVIEDLEKERANFRALFKKDLKPKVIEVQPIENKE